MTRALDTAAALVGSSETVAVLTGAGLSTASGIPDFRGPNGRWTHDPEAEKVSTLSYYLIDPAVRRRAWEYRLESALWQASPNAAHTALVALEPKLTGIVTQNTDGLHQLAGSDPALVHEVHGSARTWRCQDCDATGPMTDMVERVRAGEPDPHCPHDGGIVRSQTILFGEALDPDVIDAARAAVLAAHLLIVIGTSLSVQPVAGLVPMAAETGCRIIIINAQVTPYDYLASALVRTPIVAALPVIVGV